MQSFLAVRRFVSIVSLATTVVIAVVPAPGFAQVGSCTSPTVDAYLDVGNVRARILANGNMFWRGAPFVYEVPKGSGNNSIFAGGFWIGGKVDGEIRVNAARYGWYEFWTGPIDENGNPPDDCSEYERIWSVYRSDIEAYENGDAPSQDLAEWPAGLGAPTLAPAGDDGLDNDGDGEVDEPGEMKRIDEDLLHLPLSQRVDRVIDLDAGERPDIVGDQMLWWIMNDRGNEHRETASPIGLEVHASAFAFDRPGDIGNATFHRRKVILKAESPLDSAYVSQWYDADLGSFQDDLVGCDTTFGMAFTYNADDFDGQEDRPGHYGDAPPAIGYDFVQGPVVWSPGDTATVSGRPLADHRRLDMTSHVFYWGGGGTNEDPVDNRDYYLYFQGRWKDGRPIRAYGDGFSDVDDDEYPVTTFMYPGDPVERAFWSELNVDGEGNSNQSSDRRHLMSSGPFRMEPGDVQDIVFAIVWARGADHLDSITELRGASGRAQALADANFESPAPPDAPDVRVSPLPGSAAIEWSNPPSSNNFDDAYRKRDAFADPDYPWAEFEGYEVWQFEDADDSTGVLIETYDLDNGVTEVRQDIDLDGFLDRVTFGRDSGIQHAHTVTGLTNYSTYHFGVRAYAYSEGSIPEVMYSAFARASVTPTPTALVTSEAAFDAAADRDSSDIVAMRVAGTSSGTVSVDVVNPAGVRDGTYRVEFHDRAGAVTFDVLRDGELRFDGAAGGASARPRRNAVVVDGLEFSLTGPEPGIAQFLVTANASGELDPPDIGAFAFNNNGFPFWELAPEPLHDRPTRGYQQSTNQSAWGINAGGTNGTFAAFLEATISNDFDQVGAYEYEIRFTQQGGLAVRGRGDDIVVPVPFELWQTGIATPDDPSDDVRMIPWLCEAACDAGATDGTFDITGDHPVSGGTDDPYSDWIDWYMPNDESAGDAGYQAYFEGAVVGEVSGNAVALGEVVFERMVLVNWNGGTSPPYNADLPEPGTIFRIVTTKPFMPRDVFELSTAGYGATEPDLETQRARLSDIGIVPNPYKAFSDYEVDLASDEVRFTGLPDVATIRVFTLHGTLVRTLEKDSPGLRSMSWDVRNEDGRKLASGMYLIHVGVPGVGERVIKFGMVKDGVVE